MNILFTLLLVLLGIIVLLALLIGILFLISRIQFRVSSKRSLAQLGPEAPIIQMDGLQFRDLNKNGKLDVYEDYVIDCPLRRPGEPCVRGMESSYKHASANRIEGAELTLASCDLTTSAVQCGISLCGR